MLSLRNWGQGARVTNISTRAPGPPTALRARAEGPCSHFARCVDTHCPGCAPKHRLVLPVLTFQTCARRRQRAPPRLRKEANTMAAAERLLTDRTSLLITKMRKSLISTWRPPRTTEMFLHQGTYIGQHAGASFSKVNVSTHLLSLDSVEVSREIRRPQGL